MSPLKGGDTLVLPPVLLPSWSQQAGACQHEQQLSLTHVPLLLHVRAHLRPCMQWVLAYSGFPFPISLTLWHMTFCSAVGLVAVRVLGLVKSHNMSAREYCSRVMPIGERGGCLLCGSSWLSSRWC